MFYIRYISKIKGDSEEPLFKKKKCLTNKVYKMCLKKEKPII